MSAPEIPFFELGLHVTTPEDAGQRQQTKFAGLLQQAGCQVAQGIRIKFLDLNRAEIAREGLFVVVPDGLEPGEQEDFIQNMRSAGCLVTPNARRCKLDAALVSDFANSKMTEKDETYRLKDVPASIITNVATGEQTRAITHEDFRDYGEKLLSKPRVGSALGRTVLNRTAVDPRYLLNYRPMQKRLDALKTAFADDLLADYDAKKIRMDLSSNQDYLLRSLCDEVRE